MKESTLRAGKTTDGDIINIARRIDAHQKAIEELVKQIEDSDHDFSVGMARDLKRYVVSGVYATFEVHASLYDPDAWTCDFTNGKVKHRRAK